MGCDITIISQHNLDLTDIETLAHDLSDRFGFSITYGYHANARYNALLENDLEEGFVTLGFVDKGPLAKEYTLTDDQFQKKLVYAKFGDELFDLPEYWEWYGELPSEDRRIQEKIDVLLPDYFLSAEPESSYLFIYQEVVDNSFHYYSRWWDFCGTIQSPKYFEDDYYREFRKLIQQDTLLLGGTKAYFVNDQCNHLKGVGCGDESYYSWVELEQFIASRPTLELVSISRVALDKVYQTEVMGKKDRTLAFYDDFADLLSVEEAQGNAWNE